MMVPAASRVVGQGSVRQYSGKVAELMNKHPMFANYCVLSNLTGMFVGLFEGVEAAKKMKTNSLPILAGAVIFYATAGCAVGPFLPALYVFQRIKESIE